MYLALQFIGAIAILVPFVLLLLGIMGRQDRAYLWLNLGGSILLTADAWLEHQWGFVLLQAVWAAVTAWGLRKHTTRIGVTHPGKPAPHAQLPSQRISAPLPRSVGPR